MADTQRSIVPTFRRRLFMVVLPREMCASGVPRSAEAREIEAALAGEERGPEIAASFHAGGHVVETEVVDRDAALDLGPGDGCRDGGTRGGAHRVHRRQRAAPGVLVV